MTSHSTIYVGTYTEPGRSRGIYRVHADVAAGTLGMEGMVAETTNPSYLILDRSARTLYACNEVEEFGGKKTGAVSAFRIDPDGKLRSIAQRESRGGAPCHLATARSGRHLVVSNYASGTAALLPITSDGTLREATSVVTTGKNAHCAVVDRDDRFVFVADLGMDRVCVYRLRAARNTLDPVHVAMLPKGSGPRHLALTANGRRLYVVNEHKSTLTAFDLNPASGVLAIRQTLSIRAPGATGNSHAADLHIHPSGRTIYASNRGDDNIAVVAIAPRTGALSLVQNVSTEGKWPRGFGLDPSGRLLIVANQRSDSLVAYHIDQSTGKLTATGAKLEIPAPTCVKFT